MSKVAYLVNELKAKPESAFAKRLLESLENRPKKEYVELYCGENHTYIEKIVLKSEVKQHIEAGWRITSLSKVSPSLVIKKWRTEIDMMEQQ